MLVLNDSQAMIVESLLNWMYIYVESLNPVGLENPEYKDYPVRAWQNSPCYHLPKGCTNYPRIEKTNQQHRRIKVFKSVEKAEASNLKLCGSCKKILGL